MFEQEAPKWSTARFRYDHKPDQMKAGFRYDPLLLGYLHHLTKKTHKPFLGVEKGQRSCFIVIYIV